MNKSYRSCFFCPVIVSLIFIFPIGCSKNNDQQTEEKGRIEKMTDEAAETIEKKIQTPLDKARATQNLGNERVDEMDKAMQKQ
jgi:hypothetical protein